MARRASGLFCTCKCPFLFCRRRGVCLSSHFDAVCASRHRSLLFLQSYPHPLVISMPARRFRPLRSCRRRSRQRPWLQRMATTSVTSVALSPLPTLYQPQPKCLPNPRCKALRCRRWLHYQAAPLPSSQMISQMSRQPKPASRALSPSPLRLQHPRIRRTMASATLQMHRHGPSVRRARTTTASVDLQLRTLPLHLL